MRFLVLGLSGTNDELMYWPVPVQAASTIDTHVNNAWRVGMEGVTRHNVEIVGAVQVSAGRWMPILQIFTWDPSPFHYYPRLA